MSKFPALPLWVDAWVSDTMHLSRAERGLYHDLLVLMWATPSCRVPNDIEWISRKLRCSQDEVGMLKSIISEFCQSTGNWVTQKRLKKEFQFVSAKVEKRRDAAKSRWDKEKGVCKGNAPTPTPTPTPTEVEVRTPLAPQGGEGEARRNRNNGRGKTGYSIRGSFSQAIELIEARRPRGGEEGGTDDFVELPGLREGIA